MVFLAASIIIPRLHHKTTENQHNSTTHIHHQIGNNHLCHLRLPPIIVMNLERLITLCQVHPYFHLNT